MKQYTVRCQTYVMPESAYDDINYTPSISDQEEVYELEDPEGNTCGYIHEERLAELICTLLNEHAMQS